MKKELETTIKVADLLAPHISSRDITDKVLEREISQSKDRQIVLDFSNVDFISRSAAHQILSLKHRLINKFLNKKEISFENVNEDVRKMFSVVATSRSFPEKKKVEFEAEEANVDTLLQV